MTLQSSCPNPGSAAPLAKASLERLLSPSSIAVVGASESLAISNNAVLPMLETGRCVHLVNPKQDRVYGQPTVPSLSALDESVDAVLALVNAKRAVEVVEEAGTLRCGGVVVVAAGFGEAGEAGEALQGRLAAAASTAGLAVIGPNCSGFKNVQLDVNLFTGGPLNLRAGGFSVVSQSGFLMRSALAAARDRELGVAMAISSGNEAVCDLADHVQALVDDPHTRVIGLVVEGVRRPGPFFAAVANAHQAGKPVLALKLGRGQRAKDIIQSHTGAIADSGWVYDVAFREHGIVTASDIDELVDAAQLLVQLGPERRTAVERVGVITTSGGAAALASDLADQEHIPLPPLDELAPWVRERIPGATLNPLDLTGFVVTDRSLTEDLFERYAEAVDVLVLCWWLGDGDESWSQTLLEPLVAAAARVRTPCVVTPLESTSLGPWVHGWRERGLFTGRGLESVYRAIRAMHTLATQRARAPQLTVAAPPSPPPRVVGSAAGPMVPFVEAMQLLKEAGIPLAPYAVLDSDETSATGGLEKLGARLVVKLADVPHRTELDAVVIDVSPSDVVATANRLRSIARSNDVPDTVVVQSMIRGDAEAVTGIQCDSDLGPVALIGAGGVAVESTRDVLGRMLPIDRETAETLVDELRSTPGFQGFRRRAAWPHAELVDTVLAISELWRRNAGWLRSVDVNPLIVSTDGVIAVDALLIARTNGSSS